MSDSAGHAPIHRAIDAVWRIESAKIIARLARMVGDVGLAEDLAQDALLAALEKWPVQGIPQNPGAWLTAAAKNRAVDQLRRRTLLERKHTELSRHLETQYDAATPDLDAALDDPVGDDLLRLVFICCHPVLAQEARVALTLRLLGGLTTEEIARAFLVPVPALAQRIVRAKRTLREARIPFEAPRGRELSALLSSVLEVVYRSRAPQRSRATSGSERCCSSAPPPAGSDRVWVRSYLAARETGDFIAVLP